MPSHLNPKTPPGEPAIYELRLEGHLGQQWAARFGGLTIEWQADGHTLLIGPVSDQAALHGHLKVVRDLGIPLVSVVRLRPGRRAPPDRQERG